MHLLCKWESTEVIGCKITLARPTNKSCQSDATIPVDFLFLWMSHSFLKWITGWLIFALCSQHSIIIFLNSPVFYFWKSHFMCGLVGDSETSPTITTIENLRVLWEKQYWGFLTLACKWSSLVLLNIKYKTVTPVMKSVWRLGMGIVWFLSDTGT